MISALGGGGGNVRDLVLIATGVVAGGGSGGRLLRSSSSSRVGTPSADDSLLSLRGCWCVNLPLADLSAIFRPTACSTVGSNLGLALTGLSVIANCGPPV